MKPNKPKTDNLPRVVRGGSWDFTTASNVRAASRLGDAPSVRNDYFGFRCAQRGCRQILNDGVTP